MKLDEERKKYTEAAKEAGKNIEAGYNQVEAKVDEAVDGGITIMQKLKKAKWTAAAVSGAGLLLAFLLTR